MQNRLNVLLFLWAVVLAFPGCVSPQPTIAPPSLEVRPTIDLPEGQTVAFCDLVANPERYNHKIVRTQATVVTTFELSFLYDLPCNREEAWTYFETHNSQSSEGLEAVLGDLVRGKARRANATVIGEFDGSLKEGYGHLDSFRFSFVIMAVEKAEPVPPDVPWPWKTKK